MKIMTAPFLLIALISFTMGNPIGSVNPSCSRPPLSDLQRALDNAYLFHNPPPPDSSETNATCPSGTPVLDGMPLSRSATCPWSYVSDYDADRIPAVIMKAHCSCGACLDPYTSLPTPDLSCTPVMYHLPVLRRVGCVDGVYTFDRVSENVTVGCVCMRQVSTANRPPGIMG